MYIIYLHGPHHSGKSAFLLEKLTAALQKQQSVLGLLPSVVHVQYYKQQLVQRLGGLPPGRAFLGTFLALARHLLDSAHRTFQTCSEAEEWLTIFQLYKKHFPAGEFQPGRIRALQQLFTEWRESGLSPAELQTMLAAQPGPLATYARLYAELHQQALATARGPAAELIYQALELTQSAALVTGDLLCIDGFYEFNPAQIMLLKNILPGFATVYFTTDYFADHPIYQYSQNLPAIFGDGEFIEFNQPIRPFFTEFQEQTFSALLPPNPRELPMPRAWQNDWSAQSVKVVRCPNRRAEVETAARTIKRWLLDGLRPHEIGIVFRGTYNYQALVNHIFPQFGIPLPPGPLKLSATEPAQLILRILKANLQNFARAALLDLLRLPVLQAHYSPHKVQAFEYVSAQWGLAFGQEEWLKRCRQQLDFHDWLLTNPETEELRRPSPAIITQTQQAAQLLEQLFAELTLPEQLTLTQFCARIENLLGFFLAESTTRPAINQLKALISRLKRSMLSDEQLRLEELTALLQQALSREIYHESAEPTEGIFVGDLMSARGKLFQALVIPGLVEGEFPARHQLNPLFSNELRHQLNSRSPRPIFKTESNLLEEKFLFHFLIGRTTRYLLVTYPETDSANRTLPPSPFIPELLRTIQSEMEPALSCQATYEYVPPEQVFLPIEKVASVEDLLTSYYAQRIALNPTALHTFIGPAQMAQIDRQIEIQQQREQTRLGEFSGLIADYQWQYPTEKNKIYVTALQRYVDCPFLYLCANFWQIPIIEEPTLGIDARLLGTLIHTILKKLVSPYLNNPQAWRQFLADPQSASWSETITETLHAIQQQLHFLPAILWQQLRTQIGDGIERFCQAESAVVDDGFYPYAVEKTLEVPAAPFWTTNGAPCDFFILKGKVDRIDLNASTRQYFIIDYKSSGSQQRNILDGALNGTQLQIPLYLIMLPLADNHYQDYTVGGSAYYSFKKGKRQNGFYLGSHFSKVKSSAEWQTAVEQVKDKVRGILQAIASGEFPVAPQSPKDTCKPGKCDYYDICRFSPYGFPTSEEESRESPDE